MLKCVGLSADPRQLRASYDTHTQEHYDSINSRVPRGRKQAVLVAQNAAGIMAHNQYDEMHLHSGRAAHWPGDVAWVHRLHAASSPLLPAPRTWSPAVAAA